jgi:hypothetical protein
VQEITPKLIFFFSNKFFALFHMETCEMDLKSMLKVLLMPWMLV